MSFSKPAVRFVLISLAAAGVLFLSLEGLGWYMGRRMAPQAPNVEKLGGKSDAELKKLNGAMKRRLEGLKPKGYYIVIDTGRNILTLRKGDQVLREAVISTGSGVVLKDPKGERKWIFDTPRGEYEVRSKATDPNWIKPDWAFIEEGEPIPSRYQDRVEEGMLGAYALGFGNGYFIHGTLYTRLLGRNVTHGCVRVGDKDLEFLFKTVPIGTRIFII